MIYHQDSNCVLLQGDCLHMLRMLPAQSVNCCVTSPPYFGLRDYGVDGQIGLESTPEAFVQKLVEVFREVKRVLRDDGTLWLNLGDSYAGSGKGPAGNLGKKHNERHMEHTNSSGNIPNGLKAKDLIGIPWRVAFALQADGWYLRQDIIWHKPNPMPESVKDRCTKAHEYIFLLSKSPKYYFDSEAIAEEAKYKPGGSHDDVKQGGFNDKGPIPGSGQRSFRAIRETKNKRSVWTVATKSFKGAHFATFPPDLIKPCILAGCPKDGVVLDPFNGAGTTGLVSVQNGRNYIGIELNAEYLEMARIRIDAAEVIKQKPTEPTLFDFILEDKKQ